MSTAMCKGPQATAPARSGPSVGELGRRLSSMMPGTATVRVALQGPHTPWPHLEVRAYSEAGDRVRISRTQQLVAARWIIRAHPEAGWQQPRAFDLSTAILGGEAL